jgi:hypothetical protein
MHTFRHIDVALFDGIVLLFVVVNLVIVLQHKPSLLECLSWALDTLFLQKTLERHGANTHAHNQQQQQQQRVALPTTTTTIGNNHKHKIRYDTLWCVCDGQDKRNGRNTQREAVGFDDPTLARVRGLLDPSGYEEIPNIPTPGNARCETSPKSPL